MAELRRRLPPPLMLGDGLGSDSSLSGCNASGNADDTESDADDAALLIESAKLPITDSPLDSLLDSPLDSAPDSPLARVA